MTFGQFRRRLKKARRTSKRLANGRSQTSTAKSRLFRPTVPVQLTGWTGAENELRILIGRNA